ncbi:MAG: TrmH family RNA methyltransferase [Pirellulales bacterium]
MSFEQVRHRPLAALDRPRELVIACALLRSNINLSRIARAAGCMGVSKLMACGAAKLIQKIARNSVDEGDGEIAEGDEPGLDVSVHRTLAPVLRDLRADGYQLVALEQTTNSTSIFDFRFERMTVLIVGNERSGIDEESLRLAHHAVEIPMYGLPYALNVGTATSMALYEYCRQFPRG